MSELQSLSNMRVRNDSIDSSMATYIAKQMGQGQADDPNFAKFANNEISYEEYMRITGGTSFEDELEFVERAEREAMPPPSGTPKKKKVRKSTTSTRSDALFSHMDLPAEIRSQFLIDSELGEFVSASQSQQTASELAASLDSESAGPSKPGRVRKSNKAIDGLMGQANVACANQRFEEALSLLKEAIRQEPRDPDPYQQMADIYVDLGQETLSFEFRLLSCHLNARTSAAEWAQVGESAVKHDKIEIGAACYGNAIRCDPTDWFFYEKRIELLEALGLPKHAMKVRLQAAQAVNCKSSNVDFEWLQNLIKTAAEYYIDCLDEDKATEALKIFLLRCHEFSRVADIQHLALIGMWMGRGKYDECVKSILALCQDVKSLGADGKPMFSITVTNMGYTLQPEPVFRDIERIVVPDSLNTSMLAKLVVCLQRLGSLKPLNGLIDFLLDRAIHEAEEQNAIIDIGRCFHDLEYWNNGVIFMQKLVKLDRFAQHPEVLHLCGQFEQSRGNLEKAYDYYKQVLNVQPGFVNARINLSTVLQKLNRADEALQILMDYDLDLCTQLPDERLLIRQADVLHEQRHVDQYIRCLRMLLIPHFYPIYKFQNYNRRSRAKTNQCAVLHRAMVETLRGSAIERQIKRLGATAYNEGRSTEDLTQVELHDYCMNLVESLHDQGRYAEMAEVVYLSNLQPKLQTGANTFLNLVFFAAIKARHFVVAFEYLRFLHSSMAAKKEKMDAEDAERYQDRIFNAMNFVFCQYQSVACHRFIMRAEARSPNVEQLSIISGNNSLVTGSYRHALSEYLRIWCNKPTDPLICLLVGLTFVHMSCKKDISSRHMLAVRGMAFVSKYEKFRGGVCQETMYNMGRMLHQLGLMAGAIHFYEKVLETSPPLVKQPGQSETVEDLRYDLRPLAAHNLALIYENSGNKSMAWEVLRKFAVIV